MDRCVFCIYVQTDACVRVTLDVWLLLHIMRVCVYIYICVYSCISVSFPIVQMENFINRCSEVLCENMQEVARCGGKINVKQ